MQWNDSEEHKGVIRHESMEMAAVRTDCLDDECVCGRGSGAGNSFSTRDGCRARSGPGLSAGSDCTHSGPSNGTSAEDDHTIIVTENAGARAGESDQDCSGPY
jgi:hypothetical protein